MDIAMIGLGKMGANMANRLLLGGHRVVAYDINEDAIQAAEDAGAEGARTLEQVFEKLEAPRSVWVMVPSGQITTYSEIAQSIGHPKAVRAVGTAVGRNPISWLIPCHRALRKSGGLGGYHWGLPVKRALLAWESARLEAQE